MAHVLVTGAAGFIGSHLSEALTARGDTVVGVDNFDPAATEGYIIGVSNANFGSLILRRVSNPGGTPAISAKSSRCSAVTDWLKPVWWAAASRFCGAIFPMSARCWHRRIT